MKKGRRHEEGIVAKRLNWSALVAVLILLTAACFPAAAQSEPSVEFDIQPRLLRIGETATMSFAVRGAKNPEKPSLPQIEGFKVLDTGTQQSISIVNGRMDRQLTFTYRILPVKTGEFAIGPFTYDTGQEKVTIPEVKIKVVSSEDDGSQKQQTMEDLLFARVDVEAKEIFIQQVFDITLSIYSKGLSLGREMGLMNMDSSGLNILPFKELGLDREEVGGEVYTVRRYLGRAQGFSAGTFTMEPVVRVAVAVPRQRGGGFFNDPFFGLNETRQADLHPEPITVEVKPLPQQGRPAEFSGAVGRFTFNVSVKPDEVPEGEPVTMTMDISGQGNVESITPPGVQADEIFKVYEPKLVTKEISEDRSQGRLVFEQVLIPRSAAAKYLPEVAFSYFDPQKPAYRKLTRGPFPLKIMPSSNHAAVVVKAPAAGPESKTLVLGSDIVYLKPAPRIWKARPEHRWYASWWFLALQLMPLVVLAMIVAGLRHRDELARDVARARRQRAPKEARRGIKAARQALKQGDRARFFEALWDALSSYFGGRLNLSPGEVSIDVVAEKLTDAGYDSGQVSQLRGLFHQSELERFGTDTVPGGPLSEEDRKDLMNILARLGKLLRACEKVKL